MRTVGKGSSHIEGNYCQHCMVALIDDNWCLSRQKKHIKICDPCRHKQDRLTRERRKKEVINHYGGKCECCGITEIKFLNIDHKDGSGWKHRKEQNNIAGSDMYSWLKQMEYPDNFRVLCWNCNFAIGMKGYCPHEKS